MMVNINTEYKTTDYTNTAACGLHNTQGSICTMLWRGYTTYWAACKNTELVLNEEFYLQPSIVSILDPHGKEVSKRVLTATSAQYDQALASTCGFDRELSRTILRLDCIETSKDGEYSNMWHVYGLACSQ